MSKVKELREKAGLSQAQLAARASVPLFTIQKYEQGKRSENLMGLDTAAKLGAALNTNLVASIAAKDIKIAVGYDDDYEVTTYDVGRGRRTTLFGALEEIGVEVPTISIGSYMMSRATNNNLDEYEAKRIADIVESFFGAFTVPAELNPRSTVK